MLTRIKIADEINSVADEVLETLMKPPWRLKGSPRRANPIPEFSFDITRKCDTIHTGG